MLQESNETRQAAVAVIERFQEIRAISIQDPGLYELAVSAVQLPYIATLWLISPEGEIVHSVGSTAMQGTIEERVSKELNALLNVLPVGELSGEQVFMLSAASAIRSEGEHNDVYRHMVQPIHTGNGSLIGLIAVAYDVSPGIRMIPGIWQQVSLVALLLCVGVYWISLAFWTFLDARRRGERAWIWAVFVMMGNLMALLAYFLVRVPQPSEGQYSNRNRQNDVIEGK